MPIAVSLFDESGYMLRPFAEAGWECHMYDLETTPRNECLGVGSMHWHRADLTDSYEIVSIIQMQPDFVAGFAPCTDLAGSGALHWKRKLAENPRCQEEALRLVRLPELIGEFVGSAWFSENPVGAASKLWRKPDLYFDPCDYGGYLPEDDAHPDYPQYFPSRDAYTKKTCIWHGGGFVVPEKRPVEPVYEEDSKGNRSSPIWKKLGGKSARTKRIRSKTPRGWSAAVFGANGTIIA